MRYVEITIWHPLDGKFSWKPTFEWWNREQTGFDVDWLIFSFNVNLTRYAGEIES